MMCCRVQGFKKDVAFAYYAVLSRRGDTVTINTDCHRAISEIA